MPPIPSPRNHFIAPDGCGMPYPTCTVHRTRRVRFCGAEIVEKEQLLYGVIHRALWGVRASCFTSVLPLLFSRSFYPLLNVCVERIWTFLFLFPLFSSFFQKSCLKVLSIQKVVVPLHSLSESFRGCRSGEGFVPASLRRRRSSLTDCEQATETQHPPLPRGLRGESKKLKSFL